MAVDYPTVTGGSDPSFTFITNKQLWEMENRVPATSAERLAAAFNKMKKSRKKYRRAEACKMIGFPGSTPKFSLWLKENEFLHWDDCPHRLLMYEDLMDMRSKSIYFQPQYDCCSRMLNGSEYDIGRIIKTVYTPLFTDEGLKYFKKILSDDQFLRSEKDRLIQYNIISEQCLKGIFI